MARQMALVGCNWLIPIPKDIVNLMETIDKGPVNAQQIKKGTGRDPVMAKVRHRILMGWPCTCTAGLLPFFSRKDELSVEDGCILWGCRVLVPPLRCEQVIKELHDTHPGITLMKALAVVWFGGQTLMLILKEWLNLDACV